MGALKITVNKKRTPKKGYGKCCLCENCPVRMTKHHLVPVAVLRLHHYETYRTIKICFRCHRTLHQLYTNEELREQFNTTNKLKRASKMVAYLKTRNAKKECQERGCGSE